MSNAGFEWTVTPEDAFGDLFDWYAAMIVQVVWSICLARAPEIENWMKDNAPWTDRTGNARQTLHTQVIPALGEMVIQLSHGMDYGYWLEVAHSGKWAIIAPALDYWAPIIMQDVQRALSVGVSITHSGSGPWTVTA